MEFKISGLKCDFCTYRDDSVSFSDYEKSIGKPCPKCGNSLLTREEYENCIKMYKKFENIKRILNILKWFNPLHYWRLIFGDKRKMVHHKIKFPNRSLN